MIVLNDVEYEMLVAAFKKYSATQHKPSDLRLIIQDETGLSLDKINAYSFGTFEHEIPVKKVQLIIEARFETVVTVDVDISKVTKDRYVKNLRKKIYDSIEIEAPITVKIDGVKSEFDLCEDITITEID